MPVGFDVFFCFLFFLRLDSTASVRGLPRTLRSGAGLSHFEDQISLPPRLPRPMYDHLTLISGRCHPRLAGAISEYLGVPLAKIDLGDFPDGETRCG